MTLLKESRFYTALSFASFKNHHQCFKLIHRHALKYNLAGGESASRECITDVQKARFKERQDKEMRDWVNTPTDEKFTALHFSTYHGNTELIRIMVEEMQADFQLKNVYGANVLHIAAQGDQCCPLFYFVNMKDMYINEQDNRGSTPLHWAVYSKAEYALSYTLAMEPDLEIADQNGLTPLHLAVKAVPEMQSTRAVRALLLKGSSRAAATKNG